MALWIVISTIVLTGCDSDPYGEHWSGEETFTIGQYLEVNQDEYSKFYRFLNEGKLLGSLGAYNPYGEGYTLFLPTNDAIDRFIAQNPNYSSLEEMLQDTTYIKNFTRYHTIKRKLHTNEFPFGAFTDSTLNGHRLTVNFLTGNEQLIWVNNIAPVIKSNLEMTNGYIHVVSEVLQQSEVAGYDWLQQQDGYSILAGAMEQSKIRNKMWFNKYTLLAEHDSVFHRYGITSVDELTDRITPPGANKTNSLYQFAAYHILGGELYLNDLQWGNRGYWTLASKTVRIDVGQDIRINPGIAEYEIIDPASGDTLTIDYIRLVWEHCNIMTGTGPVHSIADMLISEPLP